MTGKIKHVTQERLKELFELTDKGLIRKVNGRGAGVHHTGYKIFRVDYRQYREHRLIWLYVHGKIPKFLDSKKKNLKTNGTIDFINGSKMFLNNSIYNHSPKVGDVLLFPNYLMHTAYPFSTKGERRSFSFNVEIDKKIANIFSK